MELVKNQAVRIEKEEISGLKFPKESVISSPESQKKLRSYLDKALSLGNLDHVKVKIYFEDDPFEFHGMYKDNEFHGYGVLYTVTSNGEVMTTTGFYQNGEYIHDDKDIVYDNWSNEFNKKHK